MKKKITDIHDKEFIKRVLRNSFVVFDSLVQSLRYDYGNDPFKMGSLPVFGKTKTPYSNEMFCFDPVYLKREKANDMIKQTLEGKKMTSGHEVQASILSGMNMRMRRTSDNCFMSVSAAKFNMKNGRKPTPDQLEAMMYLKYLSENNGDFAIDRPSDKTLASILELMSDPDMYSVFNIHVFSVFEIMVSISYHTGLDEKTKGLKMVSDMDEIFGSLAILDYEKGAEGKISDIFEREELPLFLMDFDW